MVIKKEELPLFFKLIKDQGDMSNLILRGYTYTDIMDTIEWTIQQRYVRMNRSKLIITDEGETYLLKESENKKKNLILPRKDCQISKIGLFDIYIPDKKKM